MTFARRSVLSSWICTSGFAAMRHASISATGSAEAPHRGCFSRIGPERRHVRHACLLDGGRGRPIATDFRDSTPSQGGSHGSGTVGVRMRPDGQRGAEGAQEREPGGDQHGDPEGRDERLIQACSSLRRISPSACGGTSAPASFGTSAALSHYLGRGQVTARDGMF
jgi:hypothetical protein